MRLPDNDIYQDIITSMVHQTVKVIICTFLYSLSVPPVYYCQIVSVILSAIFRSTDHPATPLITARLPLLDTAQ